MSTATLPRTCWYPHISRDHCPGCADPAPEPVRETRPLVALISINPYLVKARRGGRLVGYAIRDAYGWAIVALHRGRLSTIDRCDQPGTEGEIRDSAVGRLWFYAVTGARTAMTTGPSAGQPKGTTVTEPEPTTPDTDETQPAEEEAAEEAAAPE